MCGISGAWLKRTKALPVAAAMAERMLRRGPDAGGTWADAGVNIALGHRRLAIIDLDARANQPFASSDGLHRIVFNGEVYNFRALGSALESSGVKLRTKSDTEVALEIYRRHGPEGLKLLRGMFALAIWDATKQQLVLARDPYGIKPLYYSDSSEGLIFASQVKPILETGLISSKRDPAGALGFHLWGNVPEPFTYLEDVKSVPAGGIVTIQEACVRSIALVQDISRVWDKELPVGSADTVHLHLAQSVHAHLESDVPVGLLLSGGIDSGAIAGLAADSGVRPQAITLDFPVAGVGVSDETARARETADRFNLPLHVRTVDAQEFATDLPAIIHAMDQPSVDGVNTWFACKAVRELGIKVVLSGVGGDELFCGYDSFRRVPQIAAVGKVLNLTGPIGRGAFRAVLSSLARLKHAPKLKQLAECDGGISSAYRVSRGIYSSLEASQFMSNAAWREGVERLASLEEATYLPERSTLAAVAALESSRYLRNQLLRDSDWASMSHSVELRTPLVDWELLNRLGPFVDHFRSGRGKALLAGAPKDGLPRCVTEHRKTGFGIPLRAWSLASGLKFGEQDGDVPWPRQWAGYIAEEFNLLSA